MESQLVRRAPCRFCLNHGNPANLIEMVPWQGFYYHAKCLPLAQREERKVNRTVEVTLERMQQCIDEIMRRIDVLEANKQPVAELELVAPPATKSTRFIAPTAEQIYTHYVETKPGVDKAFARHEAEKCWNYYDGNGWKVGRNKMVRWKSAASNWIADKVPAAAPAPAARQSAPEPEYVPPRRQGELTDEERESSLAEIRKIRAQVREKLDNMGVRILPEQREQQPPNVRVNHGMESFADIAKRTGGK